MIKRVGGLYLALLGVAAIVLAMRASAAEPIEVGYIEDIKGNLAKIVLTRDGKSVPVVICGLVYNGDRFAVTDPKGTITLRLSGRPEPMVIGAGNGEFKLTVDEPKKGFLTGLVRWAAASIGDLDRKARSPVAMSVRDGPSGPLSVPLLAEKQVLAQGKRNVVIGWRGAPSMAEIKVVDAQGKIVASGRGSGRVWTSPVIDLPAGEYRIEASTPRERVAGTLEVVPASAMPPSPRELSDETVPRELRSAAKAAWLASQAKRYALEAYQLVAADADRSAPAGLVADALLAGHVIPAGK